MKRCKDKFLKRLNLPIRRNLKLFIVKFVMKSNKKMKTKTIFKKYYPFLMLLVFSATMFWGIAVTVVKSPSIASTVINPDTLKIVQLTDVHYATKGANKGSRMRAYSGDLLKDAIIQINAIPDVDMVVFSGDSIDNPVKSDLIAFAKIANTLKYPWYNALGNHEVGVGGGLSKEAFFQILSGINLNYSSLAFLRPYYVIAPKKDYRIIFMDGVINTKISSNGYFSEEQLLWLEEKRIRYKNKKVIIVQHFPLVEPIKSPSHKVLNDKKYLDILDKYNNVVAVLAGHYHCGKTVKRNGVLHITTPALVQYPNAFSVIKISPCGTASTKIEIELKDTNLKNVQAQSKAALGANAKYIKKSGFQTFYCP